MSALCRHIKSNSDRCKAPAMTGHAFYYYRSGSQAAYDANLARRAVSSSAICWFFSRLMG